MYRSYCPLIAFISMEKCIISAGDIHSLSNLLVVIVILQISTIEQNILSCQPRVTETSCFVYSYQDLESIDHLCINPIRTSDLSICVSSSEVHTLAIVNKE